MRVQCAVDGTFNAVGFVVQAALSGIYSAAVYRYAVDGQAPQGFTGTELQAAFKAK